MDRHEWSLHGALDLVVELHDYGVLSPGTAYD